MKKINFIFTVLLAFSFFAIFSLTACKESGSDPGNEIAHTFKFVVSGPQLSVPVFISYRIFSEEYTEIMPGRPANIVIFGPSEPSIIPFPYEKTVELKVNEFTDFNYNVFRVYFGLYTSVQAGEPAPFDFKLYTLKIFFDGTEILNINNTEPTQGSWSVGSHYENKVDANGEYETWVPGTPDPTKTGYAIGKTILLQKSDEDESYTVSDNHW